MSRKKAEPLPEPMLRDPNEPPKCYWSGGDEYDFCLQCGNDLIPRFEDLEGLRVGDEFRVADKSLDGQRFIVTEFLRSCGGSKWIKVRQLNEKVPVPSTMFHEKNIISFNERGILWRTDEIKGMLAAAEGRLAALNGPQPLEALLGEVH